MDCSWIHNFLTRTYMLLTVYCLLLLVHNSFGQFNNGEEVYRVTSAPELSLSLSDLINGAGTLMNSSVGNNAINFLMANFNMTSLLDHSLGVQNFSSMSPSAKINVLYQLYHNATTSSRNDCIRRKLTASSVPGTTILGAILSQAVHNSLSQCIALNQPEQDNRTVGQRISSFFKKFTSMSAAAEKAKLKCERKASRQMCTLMEREFQNLDCNVCNLLAMFTKAQEIKKCVCSQVHLSNVVQNVETCVRQTAASTAMQQTLRNYLPVDCTSTAYNQYAQQPTARPSMATTTATTADKPFCLFGICFGRR